MPCPGRGRRGQAGQGKQRFLLLPAAGVADHTLPGVEGGTPLCWIVQWRQRAPPAGLWPASMRRAGYIQEATRMGSPRASTGGLAHQRIMQQQEGPTSRCTCASAMPCMCCSCSSTAACLAAAPSRTRTAFAVMLHKRGTMQAACCAFDSWPARSKRPLRFLIVMYCRQEGQGRGCA